MLLKYHQIVVKPSEVLADSIQECAKGVVQNFHQMPATPKGAKQR